MSPREGSRLDAVLVERGFVSGREKAKELIVGGLVRVNGHPAAKPAQLVKEADAIENAVKQVLKDGYRTIDIMDEGKTQVGTIQMGDLIAERI